MKSYNPEGFGARISEEMERAGIKDIRTLHRKVEARTSARGTSYTAVFQYVKGQWPTEPSRPVVEALARVLNDVRPEYLLFGGFRKETDRLAAEQSDAVVAGERVSPITEVFRDAFPGAGTYTHDLRRAHGPGAAAEAMLWRLWTPLRTARFMLARLDGASEIDEEALGIECAHQMVRALLAPLKELDALPARRVEEGRLQTSSHGAYHARMWGAYLDDYIIAVCEALRPIVERQDNSLMDHEILMEKESELPDQED